MSTEAAMQLNLPGGAFSAELPPKSFAPTARIRVERRPQ
jgi:hypothetical protein